MNLKQNILRLLVLAFLVLFNSACDTGFQVMNAGEYAVKFAKLPTWAGGGIKNKVVEPGQKEFVMPWEELYRVDTTIQSVSWGGKGLGDNALVEDSVQSRTLDGNEVLLAITIQYHIDPSKIKHLVQYVAGEHGRISDRVRILVSSIARADIRTHMNVLSTRDFFKQESIQVAIDRLKLAMNRRLNPEGIIIDSVIYNDRRFERVKSDGSVDDSYQQKIDETQATNQETEQELKRVNVVTEEKKIRFNEEQARVNRMVEEAKGRKDQAVLRGDAYFQSRKLESERIKNVGKEFVEGLVKRIESLSGPGGKALLKIEIAEELKKSESKFILIGEGTEKSAQNALEIEKVDTNELLRQIGIVEALKKPSPKPNTDNIQNDKD